MRKKSFIILSIESSCDELSISLINSKFEDLVTCTYSQVDIHKKFGGVIPEIASRVHLRNLLSVLKNIDDYLKSNLYLIDFIAVTIGPGLSGSLMIGLQIGKILSLFLDIPLIPVHHLLGHVYSVALTEDIEFPYLSLVASGGHTEMIYLKKINEIVLLGRTQDDAIGEVYDKIARRLGLTYPGGPNIDNIAQKGEKTYEFTKVSLSNKYNFSFSGIKTQCINLINTKNIDTEFKHNLACSFQTHVINELLTRIIFILEDQSIPLNMISITGGVSANLQLRDKFMCLKDKYHSIKFSLPELRYTGDNAAMIGAASLYLKPISNKKQIMNLDIRSNLKIEEYFELYQK